IIRLISYAARTVRQPDLRSMGVAAWKYLDVVRYRLPSQLLVTFSAQAPILFAAALFGAEDAGQLSIALVALSLPLSLVGTSVGKAYFGEIAALGYRKAPDIYRITVRVVGSLILMSLVPGAILFLWAPIILPGVLGHQWALAG